MTSGGSTNSTLYLRFGRSFMANRQSWSSFVLFLVESFVTVHQNVTCDWSIPSAGQESAKSSGNSENNVISINRLELTCKIESTKPNEGRTIGLISNSDHRYYAPPPVSRTWIPAHRMVGRASCHPAPYKQSSVSPGPRRFDLWAIQCGNDPNYQSMRDRCLVSFGRLPSETPRGQSLRFRGCITDWASGRERTNSATL